MQGKSCRETGQLFLGIFERLFQICRVIVILLLEQRPGLNKYFADMLLGKINKLSLSCISRSFLHKPFYRQDPAISQYLQEIHAGG